MSQPSQDSPQPLKRAVPKQDGHKQLESSDDGDLPEWAANFRSPYTGGLGKPKAGSSSDDERAKPSTSDAAAADQAGPSGREAAQQDTKQDQLKGAPGGHTPQKSPGSRRRGGRGAGTPGSRKRAPKANDAVDSAAAERGKEEQQPGTSGADGHADVGKQKQGTGSERAGGPALEQREVVHADVGKQKQVGGAEDAGGAAREQGAEAKPKEAGEGASAGKSEKKAVPVMLPDKLPRNKVLSELCPGEDDQLVDLAGDSGAVGRMIVAGEQGSEQLQIDLKGAMCDARVMPLAGTAMVVNIGPNEAKVEALVNDYVRFEPQQGLHDDEDGGYGKDLMVSDDDDEYRPEQKGQDTPKKEAKGGKKAAKAGPKPDKKAKAGSGKKPRSGAGGGKASGGVRKKTSAKKPAGSAKPKKKTEKKA